MNEQIIAEILSVSQDTDGLFFPFSFRAESVYKVIADAIGQVAKDSLPGVDVPRQGHPGATRPIPQEVPVMKRKKQSHVYQVPETHNWETWEVARYRLVDGLLFGIRQDSNDVIFLASDVDAVRQAFRPMVDEELLVPASRGSYPLLVPTTLLAGYYAGVESGVSAAGKVILEMIDGSDPGKGDEGSPLLGRLAGVLSASDGDLICTLTNSLISPQKWPERDRELPLRLYANSPTLSASPRRRIIPFVPVAQLAQDIGALLDAYERKLIDRQQLYRLFGSLSSLRLAQYITAAAVLASKYARAIRRIVTSDFSATEADRGKADLEAVQRQFGLEFRIGESVYRTLQEPLEGYLRDIKLIQLALRRGGMVGTGKTIESAMNADDWDLRAAIQLLDRLVELGREGTGLSQRDLDEFDRADYGTIKAFETVQALLKWRGGAFAAKRGSGTTVFPSDDLLFGLVLVHLEGNGSMLFEDFIARLGSTGLIAKGAAREMIADRLSRMGLLTEMPDAERFREVAII